MKEEKKQQKEEGYLSFDPEELKNATQEGDPNDEAYELLWEATCVSSHINDADKAAGHTDDDNVYPTTAAEVDAMEALVNQAEAALKEPNAEFSERVKELRNIIEWSRQRHWKLNWRVILGVVITVIILAFIVDGKEGDVLKAQKKIDQIEKWEMAEIAKFNLDSLSQTNFYFPDDKFVSAKVWNEQEQRLTAWEYRTATANIEYNKKTIADKTKDRETRKEAKKNLKKAEKKQEASLEKFAELQDMSLKKMKKLALVEAEANLDEAESAKTVVWLWNIFFLLLIPVYIFAARPYGYTISRHRREAENLGKIEKIGLWLSGGLMAAGAGIGFVDVVTKWSDGSVTREDDGTGAARLALKVFLFVAAVLVFCAVSCLLMLYATITGLIRNYDWSEVKKKAVIAGETAKAKYDEMRSEQK